MTDRRRLPPPAPPGSKPDGEPSPEERLELLTVEVLKIWGEIATALKRIEDLELDAKEGGRAELPSYTSLSFRPTGARVKLQGWRPSTSVLLCLIVCATAVVVGWLFRR